jgi:hypothetical protein
LVAVFALNSGYYVCLLNEHGSSVLAAGDYTQSDPKPLQEIASGNPGCERAVARFPGDPGETRGKNTDRPGNETGDKTRERD